MTGRAGSIRWLRIHNATSQVESFSVSICATAEEVQGYVTLVIVKLKYDRHVF